jgi:hypothetical protein
VLQSEALPRREAAPAAGEEALCEEIARQNARTVECYLEAKDAENALRYYLQEESPPRLPHRCAGALLECVQGAFGPIAGCGVMRRALREGPGIAAEPCANLLGALEPNAESAQIMLIILGETSVAVSRRFCTAVAAYFEDVGGEYHHAAIAIFDFLSGHDVSSAASAARSDARLASFFDVQRAMRFDANGRPAERFELFGRLVDTLNVRAALHLAEQDESLMRSHKGKALLAQGISSNDAFLVLHSITAAEKAGITPSLALYHNAAKLAAQSGLHRAASALLERARTHHGPQAYDADFLPDYGPEPELRVPESL